MREFKTRRAGAVVCGSLAALIAAGCGASDSKPPPGPSNAVDAARVIGVRFGQRAGFGCVVQPTIRTAKVIVRDKDLIGPVRDVAPDLYQRGQIAIVVDPDVVDDRDRGRIFAELRRSVKDPLVVNLTSDLGVTQCPQVSIDVPRKHRLTGRERAFVRAAERAHGQTVIVRRVARHTL
jgi:hypothetical protein